MKVVKIVNPDENIFHGTPVAMKSMIVVKTLLIKNRRIYGYSNRL
jgi:hypothetical protein